MCDVVVVMCLQDQERVLLQQGYETLQVLEAERIADLLKAGMCRPNSRTKMQPPQQPTRCRVSSSAHYRIHQHVAFVLVCTPAQLAMGHTSLYRALPSNSFYFVSCE